MNYLYISLFFSIAKEHAVITNKNGTVTLKPGAEAKNILVNGAKISKETQLSHNDRYFQEYTITIIYPQYSDTIQSGHKNVQTLLCFISS